MLQSKNHSTLWFTVADLHSKIFDARPPLGQINFIFMQQPLWEILHPVSIN